MQRKILFALSCAILVGAAPVFASPTVTITAPVLDFNTGNAGLDTTLEGYFGESVLRPYLNTMQSEIDSQLAGYGGQEKLAQGFADANMFASRASTLQGYQGYKLFAVSAGFMLGTQLPSSDLDVLQNIGTNFENDPDIYLGAVPALSMINVGVNAGKIMGIFSEDLGDKFDRMYVNMKFGTFGYKYPIDDPSFKGDVDFKTTNFGLGVNYQLVKPVNLLLVKWRGVSVGSGFNIQKNTVSMVSDMDTIVTTYSDNGSGTQVSFDFAFDPDIAVSIEASTFSIPLEVSTAVQLFWFLNVTGGAGIDLAFGNTDINATVDGQLSLRNLVVNGAPGATVGGTPGTVSVDASTKDVKPKFIRPRLSTGIGFSLGPVKIDVPISVYIGDGYSFGITTAFVW